MKPTPTKKIFKKYTSGFTLVELMVSIGIMIMILSLVMVNYKKFDSGVVLTNLAYDVGLSIRNAQTYGINVRGVTQGINTSYSSRYGVHFEMTSPNSYFIFADNDNSSIYESANDTVVDTYRLMGGYVISALCVISNEGVETCSVGNDALIDITFKRPNPDASFYVQPLAGTTVVIKLQSKKDPTGIKNVIVNTTGQISIKDDDEI
jgi:Tfp pilus assembly protein FimT